MIVQTATMVYCGYPHKLLLRRHLALFGAVEHTYCPKLAEEDEMSQHYLGPCEVYKCMRQKVFGLKEARKNEQCTLLWNLNQDMKPFRKRAGVVAVRGL